MSHRIIESFFDKLQKKITKDPRASRVDTAARSIIEDIAFLHTIEHFSTFLAEADLSQSLYLETISRLFQEHLISGDQKQLLAMGWYNERYRSLIARGFSHEVAEGMISVEMSFDPSIPEPLKKKVSPELEKSGVNGTYFIKDRRGRPLAVFKPGDQEVGMPDNPKGFDPERLEKMQRQCEEPLRWGQTRGTSFRREIAAAELAHPDVGIPPTMSISFMFPDKSGRLKRQTGSYQHFVSGQKVGETSFRAESFAKKQVQMITAFDLLFGNSDRHTGNFLIREGQLIPIDHGLILGMSLSWRKKSSHATDFHSSIAYWPQNSEPIDPSVKKWIEDYNIERSLARLRALDIDDESIREHQIRAYFVKMGIERGFTLEQLAVLASPIRSSRDSSWLNQIVNLSVEKSKEDFGEEFSDEQFLSVFNRMLDANFFLQQTFINPRNPSEIIVDPSQTIIPS